MLLLLTVSVIGGFKLDYKIKKKIEKTKKIQLLLKINIHAVIANEFLTVKVRVDIVQ